jgi:hypothetical protein
MNVVELAQTLGNFSEACRILNVSREHYYDIKSAIIEDGIDGLFEKSRKMPRIGNRLSPELKQLILDYSLVFPTYGQKRVCNELKKKDHLFNDGGVRGVWSRHGILRKSAQGVVITTPSERVILSVNNVPQDPAAAGVGQFGSLALGQVVVSEPD